MKPAAGYPLLAYSSPEAVQTTGTAAHIEVLLAGAPRNPSIGREIPHLMRGAKLQIEAIEQMTLAPTLAIARRIYAASLSKGIEAQIIYGSGCRGMVAGARCEGAGRNPLSCASRLFSSGVEAVARDFGQFG